VDQFVAFWGEMASTWGINRIMARVYALLYCAARPLNTDDIMERLQISRGSANMNLRALVDWGIVEKTAVEGSRKDHYVAETDVWQVTARILRERERREVRPVKEQLRSVAETLAPEADAPEARPEADRQLHRRLRNLIELIDTFEGMTDALLPLVENGNEALLRRLIAAAQSLDPETTDPSSSTPANDTPADK
jgi:DNA-binding transcriptional regulator GbsR (MarR family)